MSPMFVMAGLVPAMHVLPATTKKIWMAGTSPAMTIWGLPPAVLAADRAVESYG
jgi:hypothetical protein